MALRSINTTLILILAFCFCTGTLYARPVDLSSVESSKKLQEQSFLWPGPLVKPPIYYGDAFYGYTEGAFKKMTLRAQEVWSKPIVPAEVRQTEIRFDRVFIVKQTGAIDCLDVHYGFRVWQKLNLNIRELAVYYPVLVARSKSGLLGLDFLTGNTLWFVPGQWRAIRVVDNPRQILAFDSSRVQVFNPGDGSLIATVNLPFTDPQILTSDPLLIQVGKQVWQWNSAKLLFESWFFSGQVSLQQFGSVMLDFAGELSARKLDGEALWSTSNAQIVSCLPIRLQESMVILETRDKLVLRSLLEDQTIAEIPLPSQAVLLAIRLKSQLALVSSDRLNFIMVSKWTD